MKRRGFLGALLASPVAAKAAADAGISEIGSALGSGPPMLVSGGGSVPTLDTVSMLSDYRKRLTRLACQTERSRRHARHSVHRFDPDLAANRSMSVGCKILIQAERNVIREEENERSWLESKIARLLSGDES